ncbi:hypothetical protein [Beijerinckia sp. L45]|uniref:hypothetical protein n=1 Tax=Beijerinckia sp. L45 TaxID=1641855 RepID=UPI00131D3769|nr:hypothetical protein [Beijerinckia sp. L45]
MTDQRPNELLPAIRRARIDRLNIYEVSDSELQLLERGSPESLFLNFSIFLISVALSFLTTILTSDIGSTRVFIVFVVVIAVGLVAGVILLAFWGWYRHSRSTIFEQIRKRMPPDGVPIIDIDQA